MARRLLALLLLCVAGEAPAMVFYAAPPFLHLEGRVDEVDWDLWQGAMDAYGEKITTVVLHNSPGGTSVTGRRIGRDIRKRKLTTVVAGRCSSACANMFLGGDRRFFAASLNEDRVVLGYHGTYEHRTGELRENATGEYFLEMSDGKLGEQLVERFIHIRNRSGLLYFIHPAQRSGDDQALAYFCTGAEDSGARDKECENLKDVDALAQGVVTSWDVVVIPRYRPTRLQRERRRNW